MIYNCCIIKRHRNVFFFILAAGLFLFGNLQAQVTIGSDEKPNQGALLDLKQNLDGTSHKGLGLPRVLLKSLKIPGGGTNLSVTIDQATGEWDKDDHIGLVVYHAGEYDPCDSYTFSRGAYVWDGDKWQFLGKKERAPEVKEFVDTRNGEIYPYRSFGDAGEWMLENLRYIPDPQEYPDFVPSLSASDVRSKVYCYPNSSDPAVPSSTWRPEQGLLYTYAAITLGVQDAVDINQGKSNENPYEEGPINPIQGICPPGWHIPSDKEWSDLEKEIYENADKYSQYTIDNGFPFDPNEWQDEWNFTENDVRGSESTEGHGIAMLSQCPPIDSPISLTGGKSLYASQGGFNILLVGSTENGVVDAYGRAAGFWTSSAFGEDYAWFRLFDIQFGAQAQVPRGVYGRTSLTSLRCKR